MQATIFAVFVLLIAANLIPLDATAVQIPIVNPGFEDEILSDGDFTTGGPSAWTLTTSGASSGGGTWNPTTSSYALEAPEGENLGYIQGFISTSIYQILSAPLQPDTLYELTVLVGSRADRGFPNVNCGVGLQTTSGTLASVNCGNPAPGTFVSTTVTFESPSGHPQLGENLKLTFSGDGANTWQMDFDDVRLTATALPEPRLGLTFAVALLVSASRLRSHRRRMANSRD